jgi:hypothetical protein
MARLVKAKGKAVSTTQQGGPIPKKVKGTTYSGKKYMGKKRG